MDTALGSVATVNGALVVVVAEIGRPVSRLAARVRETDSLLALIIDSVASDGSPLAKLVDALVEGAGVLVIALIIVDTLGNVVAKEGGLALALVGDTLVGEATGIGLARNIRRDALVRVLVASPLLAEIVRLEVADLGGLGAADIGDDGLLAEVLRVTAIRRDALTADAETAAATAGVDVLRARTGNKLEEVGGKGLEVIATDDTLLVAFGNDEHVVGRDVTIGTNTKREDGKVGDLGSSVLDGLLEVDTARGVVRAVVSADVVIVVAVSEDDEHLGGGGTAAQEVVDTHADAGRDRSTAAAAAGLIGIVLEAALEVIDSSNNVVGVGALGLGQGGPGGRVEVDNGEGSIERAILELVDEARNERLLINPLDLRDGSRAIKDKGNIHGLATFAVRGGIEARSRRGAGNNVGERDLAEVAKLHTARESTGIEPQLVDQAD